MTPSGPGGPAVAPPDALAEAVERLALDGRDVPVHDLGGRGLDVGDGRVLDVDPDTPREPLAEVRMQTLLDLRRELVGRTDHELVERLPLEAREEHVERVAEVIELLLLDPALEALLRPAALVVLAVDVVLDLVDLRRAPRRCRRGCGRSGG